MLAAVVQMTSGSDLARESGARGRAGRARPPRAGAQLVALPENFPLLREEGASGPNPHAQDVPGEPGAALPLRAGRSAIGSCSSAAPSPSGSRTTRACSTPRRVFAPRGELLALYRKIHLFDVDLPGRVAARVVTRRAGQGPGGRQDRRRARSASRSATTCASRSSTGSSSSTARRFLLVPSAFTRDDRARPLGSAAARAGDREPVLRGRRRAVGRAQPLAPARTAARW